MRGSFCLLLLAGCNAIFGLDTTDVDTDTDGDGVFDVSDVCPSIADDQADDDGDAIGNACDTCPTDPDPEQHDEDRDGQGDACDPCPLRQDFADADADGDGIGDACDPFTVGTSMLPSQRLLFDPFVSLAPEWTSQSSTWHVGDDRVGPDTKLQPNDGLQYTTLSLPATAHVDIGVFTRNHWESGERFGIRLVSGNVEEASCLVTCGSRSMCTVQTSVSGTASFPITVVEHVFVQLVLLVDARAQNTSCFIDNSSLPAQVTGRIPPSGTKVVLVGSPNAQVTSVDVVGHGP